MFMKALKKSIKRPLLAIFTLLLYLWVRVDRSLDKYLNRPVVISTLREIVRIERLGFPIAMCRERFYTAFDVAGNIRLDGIRAVRRKSGVVIFRA